MDNGTKFIRQEWLKYDVSEMAKIRDSLHKCNCKRFWTMKDGSAQPIPQEIRDMIEVLPTFKEDMGWQLIKAKAPCKLGMYPLPAIQDAALLSYCYSVFAFEHFRELIEKCTESKELFAEILNRAIMFALEYGSFRLDQFFVIAGGELNHAQFIIAGLRIKLKEYPELVKECDRLKDLLVSCIPRMEAKMDTYHETCSAEHKKTQAIIEKQERRQKNQPRLSQEEAAKAWFRGVGKIRVSKTELDNRKRVIRGWEAYINGRGGHKPPEEYPGLECTPEAFAAWVMRINGRRKMKNALNNMVSVKDDIPAEDVHSSERNELKELADSLPIDIVRKLLDSLDRR